MAGNPAGRILIADDEEAFASSTAEMLRKHGYQTDYAPDARAAVELLRQTEYDVLISDIEMPGNADLALIRQAPQIQAGLPIILVTGYPTVQTAISSVQLAVAGYLVKPPEPQELLKLVSQAIETARTYKALRKNRQHVETWLEDLRKMEALLRPSPQRTSGQHGQLFLALTLSNMGQSLRDLHQFAEALSGEAQAGHASGQSSQEQLSLIHALRETIEVLEKTKHSFRSKELGTLRRKLEDVLREVLVAHATPQPPQSAVRSMIDNGGKGS